MVTPTRQRQPHTGRSYAGQSPAERRAARRTRLLDSGLELFGTVGYAHTAIERICQHAGVTARHFYEVFESREALLVGVFERAIAQVVEAVQAALDGADDDPERRTSAALGAFLSAYLEDPRRGRVICLEVVGVSAAIESRRREVMHLFADMIREETARLQQRGLAPAWDFRLGALALAGAVNELVVEHLVSDTPPPVSVLHRELALLFAAVRHGGARALEGAPA